ncbi:MAG: hypothetical protein R3242_02915 [Akkermansiaceae bacterium]|nr:hypothetical protein [Akkermansiaceae bacterium]
MNRNKLAVSAAALVTSALTVPAVSAAPNSGLDIPVKPIGAMSATPTVVQTGTHPTLNWAIVYPSKVSDVATISPPGQITLNEKLYVSVRPVHVGVTESGSSTDPSTVPVDLRMSVDGSSYDQLFYGDASDVDPSHTLYTKKLNSGSTVNFGSRYVKDGAWTPFYTTNSANAQVIALTDGSAIPTTFDLSSSGKLAENLKPYVDGSGNVEIGPMSVLILVEAAETDQGSGNFDYQDAAFLVSLSTKNNNGHGNNLDGVDSSNPGAGSGGPNGAEDPSGGVDDEK